MSDKENRCRSANYLAEADAADASGAGNTITKAAAAAAAASTTNTQLRPKRSKWTLLFGRIVIFMTIVSFLFVGLLKNLLQLIIFLALQFSNKHQWKTTLKRINGNLIYILFSPPISLIYYWSKLDLNIQLDDVNLIEDSKKPLMAIIIPNHSFELDYMVCFALADQLGNLGAYKSMSKNELKYLPVVGWALWMSDIIFVKRNWKEDKLDMDRKLDQLFYYDQSILGVFAEGTRWTEEKHRESESFAKSRGIKPFKYHLLPRKRGFNYTIRHYLLEIIQNKRLDEKLFRLFNMEIIMPDRPKFKNFLNGDQLKAHIYCEEVHLSKEIREEVLNSKDEDDCPKLTQLLFDIFRRKDEIVDEFYLNGQQFSIDPKRGGPFPLKSTKFPLIVWLLGLISTYSLFIYLALTQFSQSITFWSLVIGFIGGCVYMMKRIESESQATPLKLRDNQKGASLAPATIKSDKKVSFNCPDDDDDDDEDETDVSKSSALNNNNNNDNSWTAATNSEDTYASTK